MRGGGEEKDEICNPVSPFSVFCTSLTNSKGKEEVDQREDGEE